MNSPSHLFLGAIGISGTTATAVLANVNPVLSFVCGMVTIVVMAPAAWAKVKGWIQDKPPVDLTK